MPQAEDQEMKAFVVRTDVSIHPAWIKLSVRKDREGKFEATEDERVAHRFTDYDEAQNVADDWSDVSGVWRVERA